MVLAEPALRTWRGREVRSLRQGVQSDGLESRLLDGFVRARLWPLRHDARAVERGDGTAAGPLPQPMCGRDGAQFFRGVPDRRSVRRGAMGAAGSRHLDRDLRARWQPVVV